MDQTEEGDRAHVSIPGVNAQLRQKTEVMRSDMSLTHEAAVEHPGSHQQEGQLEEDEVVMIPGTWRTTGSLSLEKNDSIFFFDDIHSVCCVSRQLESRRLDGDVEREVQGAKRKNTLQLMNISHRALTQYIEF